MSAYMSKINFIHLRKSHYTMPHTQNSFVKQLHAKGGATIAWTIADNGQLNVSVSICSDKDIYQRKIGARIAKSRLDAGNYLVLPSRGGATSSSTISRLAKLFCQLGSPHAHKSSN